MAGAVFGPDRPAAAARAIFELEQARVALPVWPDAANLEAVQRFLTALEVREQYSEYGDTFRGH